MGNAFGKGWKRHIGCPRPGTNGTGNQISCRQGHPFHTSFPSSINHQEKHWWAGKWLKTVRRAHLSFYFSRMGHSYFGIHTLRADADSFPQTPISKHIRGLGTPGDRSAPSISRQSWAVCAKGCVPGLRNWFPQLCRPNLTLRNSSPLWEKETDRPTDGCRREEGGIDWLLPW